MTASTGRGAWRLVTRPAALRHLRRTSKELDQLVRYADRIPDPDLIAVAAAADRLRDTIQVTRKTVTEEKTMSTPTTAELDQLRDGIIRRLADPGRPQEILDNLATAITATIEATAGILADPTPEMYAELVTTSHLDESDPQRRAIAILADAVDRIQKITQE